jgi:macrolide transport system ATP-binding/permease protein
MGNDFRFALRQLAAAKGYTLTAIVTLALGIGANTGIFTLVHAVLVKSLPVSDPATIVRLGDGNNCCVIGASQGHFSIYSYPLYTYLRDRTPEVGDMAAFKAGPGKVGVRRAGTNASDPTVDQFVSGNFFTLFGIRPYAGRVLAPTDDLRGAQAVAVMSYRLWHERYGGDPSIIGSTFVIEGAPFTIVGIAPPGFFGAMLRPDPPDLWMPLAAEPATHGKNALLDRATSHWLYVFGRVPGGVDRAPIEAKLNVELRQWLHANETLDPKQFDQQSIALVPGGAGTTQLRQYYENDLRVLLGITGLVLLIACANLANLQLARGAANAAQNSIRVALGAPRSRLVRQVLIESTILAVAGGLLGLFVATETASLLLRISLSATSYVPIDATPSLPVLGFTFVLSVLTGAVFGIAPAWSASRADAAVALRGAGRGGSGRTTLPQRSLVVLQAALSLVLLSGAGLMVQTLRNLTGQQFGFAMQSTVVANVNAGFGSYGPEKLAAVYGEIDRQVRQIPGVRDAALALYSPMSGDNWQMGGSIESHPNQRIDPSWDRVSPSFFDTIGAHILRGRGFDQRDGPAATHVAIVNETFARYFSANEDPLGKRFGLGDASHRADYTIVGIVNDIRFRNPRGPARPMFFVPLLQMSAAEWEDTTRARSNIIQAVILRVEGNPPGLGARVQRTLGAIDPNLTTLSVNNTSEMLGQMLSREEMIGVLAEIFGLLALVLASVGLYGLTAYAVARRTAEIGVRSALGATRGQIVQLILKGALSQAGVGLLLGIPAAVAAGRVLNGQVYGVKTSDPLILAVAGALLALSAAIAGLIPAARAAAVDPVRALRVDN